jgi:hypothetical protein
MLSRHPQGPIVRKGLGPKHPPMFDEYRPHLHGRKLPPPDDYYLAGVTEGSEYIDVIVEGRPMRVQEAHVSGRWVVHALQDEHGDARDGFGRLKFAVMCEVTVELRPSI